MYDYIALGELDRGNSRENKWEITWETGREMTEQEASKKLVVSVMKIVKIIGCRGNRF